MDEERRKMDNCILDNICKFISDHNTYYNFCLASKKTSYIGNLWSERKMKQFSSSIEYGDEVNYGDTIYYIDNELPNGMKHGLCYSYSHPGDPIVFKQIYYKDILLVDWMQDDRNEKIIVNYSPHYMYNVKYKDRIHIFVEEYLDEILRSKGYKRGFSNLRGEHWCLLK